MFSFLVWVSVSLAAVTVVLDVVSPSVMDWSVEVGVAVSVMFNSNEISDGV